MNFGPDGFLYVVFGDGGNADDMGDGHEPNGNGQNPSNIYGSMIRIDVDGNNSANGQYGIPAGNPFVDDPAGLDEVFAYGFRNPFRFGFDLTTGELIVGDVGQNDIEEIDVVRKSGNYGWNIKEGSFFFDPNGSEDGFVTTQPVREVPDGLIDPIAEYDHDEGLAVIGGFIYRGNQVPGLAGKYVTGDFQFLDNDFGRLFYLDADNEFQEFQIGMDDRNLGMFLKGFGQDREGEIYVFGSTEIGPFGSGGMMMKIVSPYAPPVVDNIQAAEGQVDLAWSGGAGPYTVRRHPAVDDPLSINAADTTSTTATVPQIGDHSFFTLADRSLLPEVPLSVWLTGEAARPEPVSTTGGGFGLLSLQGNRLVFNIGYTNLTGQASAAHIHGPATPAEAAGVLVGLEDFNGPGFAESGSLAGSFTLAPTEMHHLIRGRTYVNIHTPGNPGGEIRGQIVPLLFTAELRGANEQPDAVESPGHGTGQFVLVGNRLTFNITYRDLPEEANAAHIHGPADLHEAASVMIGLGPYNGEGFGRNGTLSGSLTLELEQYAALIAGRTYVNVHTPTNPGGEIRGQILPEISAQPFTAQLSGQAERPDPVSTSGTGTATAALEGDTLFFNLYYTGLSGPAIAAHIHGPASVENAAEVLIGLEPFNGDGFGSSGTLSGHVTLSPEQQAIVTGGMAYFNVHTDANPGGEIRGQIVPLMRKSVLSGTAARPTPVDSPGDGFGLSALVRDRLAFQVTYTGLTDSAVAAHIHGPASFEEAADVLIDLEPYNAPGFGTSGMFQGEISLEPEIRRHLINQRTYINVHTSTHPDGEIRGQITR